MHTPSSSQSSSPYSVLVGRLLLAALAAGALVAALIVSRDDGAAPRASAPTSGSGSASSSSAPPSVTYTCPMHAEVSATAPGDCPICRMALERREAAPAAASGPGVMTVPGLPELHAFDAVSKTKPFDLSLEMRAPAWAESRQVAVALLHLDERDALRAGESALFFPSRPPRDGAPAGIPVRLTGEPAERWDGSTAQVRFRATGDAVLEPGETGSIKLDTRLRNGLVVRSSAILRGPDGPYVLVASNDRRTYTRRSVEIGNVIYGHAAVISGLAEGELVACKHTAALDAERRIQAGSVTR